MENTLERPQVWETLFPTGGDLYALGIMVFGVLIVVVAAIVAHDIGFGGAAFIGLSGLWFIGAPLWSIFAPARRVEVDSTGKATFIRRNRRLVIEAGELTSITTSDANRVMPMLVTASSGTIRFKPPAGTCDQLWQALARSNPQARLANPHSYPFREIV